MISISKIIDGACGTKKMSISLFCEKRCTLFWLLLKMSCWAISFTLFDTYFQPGMFNRSIFLLKTHGIGYILYCFPKIKTVSHRLFCVPALMVKIYCKLLTKQITYKILTGNTSTTVTYTGAEQKPCKLGTNVF